ncbi:MAG: DUF932 domain-containing protein [Candidatus Woesearchaeota archaeon]
MEQRTMMEDVSELISVMATRSASHLSKRYQFIPTTRVIEDVKVHGWLPVRASEVQARSPKTIGLQKHMVVFRNPAFPTLGKYKTVPEILLYNSHDGSAAYQIFIGLFRLICSNGMVVADSLFGSFKIRHVGYTQDLVREAVENVLETIPKIFSRINQFNTIEMTRDDQEVYAMAAVQLRWNEEEAEKKEINYAELIRPIRKEDEDSTLWNTYNILQEKLVTGGVGFIQRARGNDFRTNKGIRSISEVVRVNKALWLLTEKFANRAN